MRASEVVVAILARIEEFGDGEMVDSGGWPVTHVGAIRCDSGHATFTAESDEDCTCIDRTK